jgi:DNA-binding NarL/FixJ family response regulator
MSTIQIVLADDHPLVRRGIRNLIRNAPDIEVIGEASNGPEALRMVEELTPDVLLLDMEMPGLNGVEVTRRLRVIKPSVRILVLSTYTDKQYILGALASGAAGYLTKEEAIQTLIRAIRQVASGQERWVSRRVAAKIDDWTDTEPAQK